MTLDDYMDSFADGGPVKPFGFTGRPVERPSFEYARKGYTLPEVVVGPQRTYPYAGNLSKEEKEHFQKEGPIGNAVRNRAEQGRNFTPESVKDFAGSFPKAALEGSELESALLAYGAGKMLSRDGGNPIPGITGPTFEGGPKTLGDVVLPPQENEGFARPVGRFLLDAVSVPTYTGASASALRSTYQSLRKLPSIYQAPLREVAGHLKGGTRQDLVEEGNKWLKEWIDNPITQKKLENFSDDYLPDRLNVDRNFIENFPPSGVVTAENFTPSTSYMPLHRQFLDERYIDLHDGNTGVSMNSTFHPNTRRSYISRNAPIDNISSTTVHEGTHDWMADAFRHKLSPEAREKIESMHNGALERLHKAFPEKEPGEFIEGYRYFTNPTELHARIMETRKLLGMKPGQHMTLDQSEEAIEAIRSGKSPINRAFGLMLTAPQLRQLHKFFPAAAGAVAGTAALQDQKYASGGPVRSGSPYEAQEEDEQESSHYNIDRARALGYAPDETGHLPSVDAETGYWLKSKKHPTAYKELLAWTLNNEVNRALNHPVQTNDGYFGEDQLRYDPREYAEGGPVKPAQTTAATVDLDKLLQQKLEEGSVRESSYVQGPYRNIVGKSAPRQSPETVDLIQEYDQNSPDKKFYGHYSSETSEEVKQIQRRLNAQGAKLVVDGKFGPLTKAAWEHFEGTGPTKTKKDELAKELLKKDCDREWCAEYVSDKTDNAVLGSAWEMKEDIVSKGGKVKYNIYDAPSLKNAKNWKESLQEVKKLKQTSKAKADMFEVGDVVGLVNYASEHHEEAFNEKKGNTSNTHVGIVTAIKNGKPIISHNIHGKLHHDPYNNLTIGWVASRSSEAPYRQPAPTGNLQKAVEANATEMTKNFNLSIPKEQMMADVLGILQLESAGGKHAPSDLDVSVSKVARGLLGLPNTDADISRGAGKFKLNSLTERERAFLKLTVEDLETPDGAAKAASYLYAKNLKRMQTYAKDNPQLKLSEEDIRNAAILGYNEGMSNLTSLGYRSPYKTEKEEVEAQRKLYSGNVKDISSTRWKYLKDLGLAQLAETMYAKEYPEGHPSYISRVRKHGQKALDDYMDSLGK